MYSSEWRRYWFPLLYIVVISICLWITIAVIHSTHQPPASDTQKAKEAFISACTSSNYGNRVGVPNVTVNPWTCVIPADANK